MAVTIDTTTNSKRYITNSDNIFAQPRLALYVKNTDKLVTTGIAEWSQEIGRKDAVTEAIQNLLVD